MCLDFNTELKVNNLMSESRLFHNGDRTAKTCSIN